MITTDTIRHDATAYLERTGNTDLLPILGLVDEPRASNGRRLCPICEHPLPDPIANGGNKPCRRKTCREETEA